MIKTCRHKGLKAFFETGNKAGIQPQHETRLRMQLARLHTTTGPDDMDLPSWRLHPLKGKLQSHWAVWVDKNWRITFRFEGGDAVLVDYQDYH
ncbi:Endoribonuclease HigB [Gammaproteobacteria bacterium]